VQRREEHPVERQSALMRRVPGGRAGREKGKVDTPQGGAMWVRLRQGRTKERREREAQDTRRVEGRIGNHQGREEIC
jgi:hypothetical protein